MNKDLIFRAVEIIGGEDAVKVAKDIIEKGKATEDELTKDTGVKLPDLRKIMFKLKNFSLVTSESIQDKATGWLIFYWRLRPDQVEGVIKTQKRRAIDKLKIRLEFEKSHDFYHCQSEGCNKVSFEVAMDTIFRCPKCGNRLMHFENSTSIEALTSKIELLQKELDNE